MAGATSPSARKLLLSVTAAVHRDTYLWNCCWDRCGIQRYVRPNIGYTNEMRMSCLTASSISFMMVSYSWVFVPIRY